MVRTKPLAVAYADLVVAGPGLVALQGIDPARDGGAILVLALVGLELGQVAWESSESLS